MNISELTLKQKIAQMFIVGFKGTNFNSNKFFVNMLENYLGGVIYFSHNIQNEQQFKKLIFDISSKSSLPLFHSIDQEGGKVERTENIHNGKKYLSAKNAYEMGLSFLQNQTKEIALELKNYGINMNFAPVLDVNTNVNNPIIGERAYSNNAEEVINAIKVVIDEFEKYKIIAVGKHFPGHGDANADSHKTLPIIDLSKEELFNVHIKPFEFAINKGISAIMAAHVLYPNLTNDHNLPASISKEIINDLLIKKLNFNGIILTDDMEMNGIKGYTKAEACIKAVNAGVSMFIFREATDEVFNLISLLEKEVLQKNIDEKLIDNAVKKIIETKQKYKII